MHSTFAGPLLALSIFAMPGFAQSIQATATAPITMSIQNGAATLFSATVPSGVLPVGGSTTIGQPGTQSHLNWFATQANTGMTFSMHWNATLASPTDSASLQGQGVLLTLSAPFASAAMLDLAAEHVGFVGASPSVSIDVGDDGIAELTQPIPLTSISIVLGPVPTLVRVRIDANQVGSGSSTMWLRCRPNNVSDVQTWNIGCDSVPVRVQTTFDGNFELSCFPIVGQPTVGVLSLQLQSQVLGSSFGLPCILLPAPDIVVVFPSPTTSTIVVPQAVRPLFFFTQGVALGLFGLATGEAFVARAL